MEATNAGGDEIDELDSLEDEEADQVDDNGEDNEIDELDELESSMFSKMDPKVPAHESDGSAASVLEISDEPPPPPTYDPEVDQFFDDAVGATMDKPILKLLKIKVKPQHTSKKAPKSEATRTRKKQVRKTVPDFVPEIDVSDLLVPSTIKSRVQLPDGTRPLKFPWDSSFWEFKFQAAEVFELPAKNLRLAYTTNETKREQRLMLVKEDFTNMINNVVDYFEHHNTAIRNERLKDAAAAHNAEERGRFHAPKARQEIPDIGLLFYHQPLVEDMPTASKGTSQGKNKDSGPKVPKQESISAHTQQAHDEIIWKLG